MSQNKVCVCAHAYEREREREITCVYKYIEKYSEKVWDGKSEGVFHFYVVLIPETYYKNTFVYFR